ncbi:uncharacterized protein LOC110977172 [Acanthaster planci]|uniref:Uncharacterized protein LOC110977172 n=1 Tax=Acanthaster planci TaxID=133434 RepID=A0A8B7Y0Q7_ACAPL|nr:uncharacterized protein LOC110977172 [Acanthaster planci]
MAAYVGVKLRVSTIGGDEFEGILHSFDANSKKISLMKVSILPSGKKLTGLLHFYGQEIKDLVEVVDVPESNSNQTRKSPASQASKNEVGPSETEDNEDLNLETSEGYVYLHHPGTKLRQAVDVIKTQQLIGVATEAERLGRRAKISLLQICCANQVFLFDVLSLGPSVFTQGLADVLESPAVVKVMHDSRWASDQLYHQYSVKLTNVYDTQAADVLVRMRQLNGELPHKLNSLPECMLEYLNMSIGHVYPHWLNDQARETEADSCWLERPLSPKLLALAAGKARHLPELRVITLHHLLAEFTASVDVFLSCIRDMSDMSRSKTNVSTSVVPRQLERLVYGRLPSTDPPVFNHSSTPIGYDPLQKETVPHFPGNGHGSLHQQASSNTQTSKMPTRESPRTTAPSEPAASSEQSFCVLKTTVARETSDLARLTNGFSPAHSKRAQSKPSHSGKVAGRRGTAAVFCSPSSDAESEVKEKERGQAEERSASTADRRESDRRFWDHSDDGHTATTSQESDESLTLMAEEQSVEQDVVRHTQGRTLTVRGDQGIKGQDGEVNEGDNGDEKKKEEEDSEDDSSDEEDGDDDSDQRAEPSEESDTPKDPLPNPRGHTQTIQCLLSLSPGRQPGPPSQEGTGRKVTTRNAGSTLANSLSITQKTSAMPESGRREHTTSRLYSSILKEAGLIRTENGQGDILRVQSPAQFPALGQETHTEPQEPTRPAVGRGRARVLAQSGDMLRTIRRPVELKARTFRMRQYDFPSQEEMDRVPKSRPLLASDYYTGPEPPDGSYP